MTNAEYKKKRMERKSRNIHLRNCVCSGMGVRVSASSVNDYRRVKSAKRFIKFVDGVTCLTFLYECFGYSGYGCKKVECIHREEPTLMERSVEKLCWR